MKYGSHVRKKSLALQAMRLSTLGIPNSRASIPGGKQLEYRFLISPFPGARRYQCLVTLDRLGFAQAFVLSPDLNELAGGKPLPHIYKRGGRGTELCLYLPGSGEWSAEMWLTETFVAWTIEWLRFFELWLVDEEWRGGGKHPEESDSPRRSDSRKVSPGLTLD